MYQVFVPHMDRAADLAKCYCKYTVLFDSASDVFSLISPQDSELQDLFVATFLRCLDYIPKFAEHWPKLPRTS